MITKEMIRKGIEKGVVRIIDCPDSIEPVCEIGDYWFYFAGNKGIGKKAKEYMEKTPIDDVVSYIFFVLQEFAIDFGFTDEYDYYNAVLEEVA